MLGILAAIAMGVLSVSINNVLNESEQPGIHPQAEDKVAQVTESDRKDQHPMLNREFNR